MKNFGLATLAAVLLIACNDNDGVPKVEDFANPVDANGKPITGTEFNRRYCIGLKTINETCEKVRMETDMRTSSGEMPKGW